MMRNASIICALAISLTVSGCSSRPREFAPQLAAPSASAGAIEVAVAECRELLVAGKLDRNGRVGSGAAGAAAGGAMAVAGGAAASSAGLYGGAALASATVVLLPFVALGGAWGMAKMKRAKKEKAIRTAMTGCLDGRGHKVTAWEKTGRKVSSEISEASAHASKSK